MYLQSDKWKTFCIFYAIADSGSFLHFCISASYSSSTIYRKPDKVLTFTSNIRVEVGRSRTDFSFLHSSFTLQFKSFFYSILETNMWNVWDPHPPPHTHHHYYEHKLNYCLHPEQEDQSGCWRWVVFLRQLLRAVSLSPRFLGHSSWELSFHWLSNCLLKCKRQHFIGCRLTMDRLWVYFPF